MRKLYLFQIIFFLWSGQGWCQDVDPYSMYPLVEVMDYVSPAEGLRTKAKSTLLEMLDNFYTKIKVNNETMLPDITILPSDVQELADTNVNARRKLVQQILNEKQVMTLLKEAPNIFYMHRIVGGIDRVQGNLYSAANHYASALRFRSLKLSPELWSNVTRLNLIDDQTEVEDAQAYTEIGVDLLQAKKDFEELRRKLYVEEDNAIQDGQDIADMQVQNRKAINDAREKIKSLEKEKSSALETYAEYEASYNRESAQFLIEYADLVYQLDEAEKEPNKIRNSHYYNSINFNHTFEQNWNRADYKMAYIRLLSEAAKLDNENPAAPYRLARQYEKEGDTERAIALYRDALDYFENSGDEKTLADKDWVFIQRRLGGLYTKARNYVDAAYHYEQAVQFDDAGPKEYPYQLALTHLYNTGNYPRAIELLETIADGLEESNDEGSEALGEYYYNAFQVWYHLSVAYEKIQDILQRDEALENAISLYQYIEDLIVSEEQKTRDLEKVVLKIQRSMNRRKPDDLQEFFQAKSDHKDQADILNRLYTIRKSMDAKRIYFSLAKINEKARRIGQAIETYREAEIKGIAPDEARSEITRIEKEYDYKE